MEEETWKSIIIDDFDWNAEISDYGQVRSTKTQRIRKIQPKGIYQTVVLKHQNKQREYYIHWLVAYAFIPNDNPIQKTMVQRKPIEGLPLNHVSTLKWVTRSEVTKKAHQKETRKLTGKKIVQYDLNMNVIKEYPSIAAAGRAGYKNLYDCLAGNTKEAYKCYWAYG